MSDTYRVFQRTAADVERKENCVAAMRLSNQRPPEELLDDLRADFEFLQYLNEEINR